MRIVQTLGTPWRTLEVCKWFSLLANLAMWTWAGAWIAGQKRPFASWMSRQEGVQTKAWPDKKADLQRCLDKTPWIEPTCQTDLRLLYSYNFTNLPEIWIDGKGWDFTFLYLFPSLFENRSIREICSIRSVLAHIEWAIKWIGQQDGKSKAEKEEISSPTCFGFYNSKKFKLSLNSCVRPMAGP